MISDKRVIPIPEEKLETNNALHSDRKHLVSTYAGNTIESHPLEIEIP